MWIYGIMAVAFLLGFAVAVLFLHIKSSGNLRIDQSDPSDQPYLFLELSEDVRSLGKKKFVTLNVRKENYISPK